MANSENILPNSPSQSDKKVKEIYRAVRGGCVIEVSDGTVIYERIKGVPAEAIARAMNEIAAEGVLREWDWKNVERRLFEQGFIKECRA